jgi:hypothetical protein
MKRIDKIFLSIVLYPIFPILLFLTGWWGSLILAPTSLIPINALAGLVLGIVVDFLFINKKVIPKAYRLSLFWEIAILLFYAFGIFGFFMGVPLFHPLLGIIIGFYIARKSVFLNWEKEIFDRKLKRAAIVGSVIMLLISIISAIIALNDPYTASGLEEMLSLPFTVTTNMLIALVFIGGTGLTIIQYLLTYLTARICKKNKIF